MLLILCFSVLLMELSSVSTSSADNSQRNSLGDSGVRFIDKTRSHSKSDHVSTFDSSSSTKEERVGGSSRVVFDTVGKLRSAEGIPNMGISQQDNVLLQRIKRYTHFYFSDGKRSKWPVQDLPQGRILTWRITKHTRQLSIRDQENVMRRALAVWADVIPLSFRMVRRGVQPDIEIRFEKGAHGDGVNDPHFDGLRNGYIDTLAHAFPGGVDRKGRAGDMHIDDDNDWTDTSKLLGVAIHEFGHTLGLGHSNDTYAIMFAGYRDIFRLSRDDVLGVQDLYGARPGATVPTDPPPTTQATTVTQKPRATIKPIWVTVAPTIDPTCQGVRIDAVFEDPSMPAGQMYYAISANAVARISSDGNIRSLSRVDETFPQAPAYPDVSFSIRETNTVYFIKGDKAYHFQQGKLLSSSPKSISHVVFPERPRFAYTTKDSIGKTSIYLFGKTFFWRYSVRNPQSARNVYEIVKFSRDLPSGVNFITEWGRDNKLYAVSSDSYTVLNKQRTTTHSRPHSGLPRWLRPLCPIWGQYIPHIGSSSVMPVFSWMLLLCSCLSCLML